ncbi:MAG: hypothetical protein Kow00124_14810 [Anaerolineae bacterium]
MVSSMNLIRRAGELVWQRKPLILAGVIMAAAGGAGGGLADLARRVIRPAPSPLAAVPSAVFNAVPAERIQAAAPPDAQTALLLALILLGGLLLAALVGLIIAGLAWVFAAGLLIAGAAAPTGGRAALRAALGTAAGRLWHLLLVVSMPPLPVLLAAILSLAGVGLYLGVAAEPGDWRTMLAVLTGARWLWVVLVAVNGPALLLTLYLLIVQTFALRACVLEDAAPRAAYRRGRDVLRDHIPQMVALLALQIGAQIGLTLLLLGIMLLTPATCLTRPLAMGLNGIARAFFSMMWTLAWPGWTRGTPPSLATEP